MRPLPILFIAAARATDLYAGKCISFRTVAAALAATPSAGDEDGGGGHGGADV